MYLRINGAHGHVKLDSAFAWTTIRQIIEAGDAGYDRPKRTFSLSI